MARELEIVFVAALPIEADALRRARVGGNVICTGVALSRARGELGEIVVSCGLAGGVRADLPTGSVLIPRTVRRPDGTTIECDTELVDALVAGARRLALEPIEDPLVTTEAIVNEAERERWATLGFAGADMETGRIRARRIAAVRVILDTPHHELSSDWSNPLQAMLKPSNWPQAFWLAREAPRAARRVAAIVAEARFDGVRAGERRALR